MAHDWTPLRNALAACRRDGVAVPFWWRDDDAIAATPALTRLGELSADCALPVHLAVIPAHADQTVVDGAARFGMIPVVHGWAHADHSGGVGKKNEFQTPRTAAVDEAAQGLARMRMLFGDALCPIFVPPWNRIAETVTKTLGEQGFTALSTFGPRPASEAAKGVAQINTHIDPIWWKGTRDLVDPAQLIAQAAAHLDARRRGQEDADEPLGYLTHHLVHTDAIWGFSREFIHEMMSGGATPWTLETRT
ncbi:polysaccharide deacetylase family protein [uncultured Tateyamaria sp.]|uniref:polysaccharide deacetylase family protein n=1 Tax=uncultured Tateyamaria sp. TaxID=455651 RepID=UPI002628E6AC|nr:polysaccharide deacetylase family protein [uncultured Tateyamaria sp.]